MAESRRHKTVILAADDDENAHILLARAFIKAEIKALLSTVNDGEEVIQYLHGAGKFTDRNTYPFPHLLLLDLKMPRRSGFDVLDYLSRNPEFKSLPVIVFSSSNNEADMEKAYAMGCQSYEVKPTEFSKLVDLVKAFEKESRGIKKKERPAARRGNTLSGTGEAAGATSGSSAQEMPMAESPEMFRLLVEQVKDYAIFMLDAKGRVQSWNEGARRMKGYEPNEIVGKHFSTFYPKQDVDNGKPQFEMRMALDMGRYEDEGWRIRKDGSRFWANVIMTPVRDASGSLTGYANIVRDLTQRKMQEDSLQQLLDSEQRFRLLVDQVKDYAIFMLDAKGNVASWNQGARRLKGYSADEILGKHFSNFYTAEDKEKNHPANELSLAIRDGRYEEEGWRIRKDGSRFWANVVITALWDKRGNLSGFAKVTRDLTARKKESDILRQKTEELEAFGRTLSHDLRAPLRSISGFAQILKSDAATLPEDEKNIYLDKIVKATERMESLINDILKLSQLSVSPVSGDFVSLDEILEETVSLLEAEIQGAHGTVSIERPLPRVSGNRTLLVQIFSNLISNGLKFVRPGEAPAIRVYATRENGMCHIHVKDAGIGIAKEFHDSIFRVFQRGGTQNRFSGSGVGLAIVKKAVERIGGNIALESSEGKGSDFIVMLNCPAVQPDSADLQRR